MLIRLDKFLADMQVGTRSQVKEYIKRNRVTVNSLVVKKSDIKIDTLKDIVAFDGKEIGYVSFEYYMLNKPAGIISASNNPKDKCVVDLIDTKSRKDLFPVGRLDKDTEGLLIISNDGEMAHNTLSPKNHVDKTYYAKVKGKITQEHVNTFALGFKVDEELDAKPSTLEVIGYNETDDISEVNITIHEGKFHQVKRMFLAIGSEVLYLKRISFGGIKLDESLGLGEYRKLTEEELKLLLG